MRCVLDVKKFRSTDKQDFNIVYEYERIWFEELKTEFAKFELASATSWTRASRHLPPHHSWG